MSFQRNKTICANRLGHPGAATYSYGVRRCLLFRGLLFLLVPLFAACTKVDETLSEITTTPQVVQSPEPIVEQTTSRTRTSDSNSKTVLYASPAKGFSARCLAFIARAETNSEILSLPTLTASVDEEGDTGISLVYNLTNLKAIEVGEKIAHARCRRDTVANAARELQKLTARNLSRAGVMARVAFIDRKRPRLVEIRREVNAAFESGALKERSRDRIFKSISSLLERADGLRNRAKQQDAVNMNRLPDYFQLEQDLHDAVSQQHYLQQESDFLRNVTLSLSGGYTIENEDDPDEDNGTEGFGRASLSIKLGVLKSDWRRKQDLRLQSELDQLYEPQSGALWRIHETFRKNKVAADGLISTRKLLRKKLAKARSSRNALPEDKLAERVQIELEIIKLQSEKVEVDVNLDLIRKAQRKLIS
ncbi:MAG: hypothetical protein AAGA53_08030 [Pseudomonadota bacterium]